MHKLIHVSGLSGTSSGSAQLYKTTVRSYYPIQYVELLFVYLCMAYRVGYVH